jgi:metal-responsive CopG/Arc/MetJ family transcriptional regulator
VTFRTALKAVGKNAKTMSSKICNFSTMQNITMQYELYKELHRAKETRGSCTMSQLVRKILRQEIKRFREW